MCDALSKISVPFRLIQNPSSEYHDDFLIIPGVGAFGDLMRRLNDYNLERFISDWFYSGKSIIGICAGFQILFDSSTESFNSRTLSFLDIFSRLPTLMPTLPTCRSFICHKIIT